MERKLCSTPQKGSNCFFFFSQFTYGQQFKTEKSLGLSSLTDKCVIICRTKQQKIENSCSTFVADEKHIVGRAVHGFMVITVLWNYLKRRFIILYMGYEQHHRHMKRFVKMLIFEKDICNHCKKFQNKIFFLSMLKTTEHNKTLTV